MELRFLDNGIVQIDGARITFKNFAGAPSQYNREGDRNFAIIIPNGDIAEKLVDMGYNVRTKPPRDEEDSEFIYLPVKVKWSTRVVGESDNHRNRGPMIYLRTGTARNLINEDMVGMLDEIDIKNVDMDIRPYDWKVGAKSGRTAYLSAMEVTQNIDRFAARYAEEESPEE